MYFRPSQKNQVAYVRERDARGEDLNVSKENATSLETKSSPLMRFFKYHKGYTFKTRGIFGKIKTFTRFIAKEGTAFLWKIEGFDKTPTKYASQKTIFINELGEEELRIEDVPVEWKSKEIELEFDTLEEAVKNRVGEENYNLLPPEFQSQLQDNNLLVTVGLEPGLTPEGFNPITEQLMWREAAANAAGTFSEKIKDATKTPVLNFIPWIGLGFGAALVLALFFGWIQLRPA